MQLCYFHYCFFYDIFWVFGTDVMVTVAKNLNAPIKLIFPRPRIKPRPSMLGLGDIVLPGIYVALLLRYDIEKYIKFNKKFSINTWLLCLVCYVASLGLALYITFSFNHPQPALLYLVPGVIIPVIIFAIRNKELKELWNYDEAPKEKAE